MVGARAALFSVSILLGACASNPSSPIGGAGVPVGAPRVVEAEVGAVAEARVDSAGTVDQGLGDYMKELARASCVDGELKARGEWVVTKNESIKLGRLGLARKSVGELSYAGGYRLSSIDERFGGISGIDYLDDGSLLGVTDQGDWFRLQITGDGEFAQTFMELSNLHDDGGRALEGKRVADAEGMAVLGDWAFVSFERDHRVLAYNFGACGFDARGVPIARLNERAMERAFDVAGMKVGANAGPEPLAVTQDFFVMVGTETQKGGRGPLSIRPIEAVPEFALGVEQGAPDFVGLDVLEGENGRLTAYSLHRGYSPDAGNSIIISETVFDRVFDQGNLPARVEGDFEKRSRYRYREVSSRRLARLGAVLYNVDNFEAIATRRLEDGNVRLLIVSDDNFSARQRTLLMMFDLAVEGAPES